MASSSSSSLSRTRRQHRVFVSFHGQDARKTFLSHLRKQFSYHGISMFNDERMERGQTIYPELIHAIWGARISIVVLSEKYASSSWCLEELVEILKCKKDMKQLVMTVFHGKFGIAFSETCASKTEEERRSWSQALKDVGNIAGEHFKNWVNEAEMIEKIAKDVLDKLNVTPCRDFDDLVGIQAHLREMMSRLDLDNDGVKVVAISGPAGIGKTTIAWALHSLISNRFQLTCFVNSLRGSCRTGFDEYGSKLHLQEQILSKVLNHDGLRIPHLDAVKENLCDQKVLIILDDVENLKQLEALAGDISWFGPGSRIVVTTENKELLQQHGIEFDNTYHVGFPSEKKAIEILHSYAFIQSSTRYGAHKFLGKIAELCGNLPLALCVVGSSLRGKGEDEWEDVVNRLKRILPRDVEDVLRFSYESLDENEQRLFLHIATFFNNEYGDHVKAMFEDDNLEVKCGLNILVYRSLIEISTYGNRIVMHKLLRRVARQAICEQKPWKRQILMDADEICAVLEDETSRADVWGLLFDISGISEVSMSKRALKRMHNLRFLRVYKSRDDGNVILNIPGEMEFPRHLRLLDWQAYPSKCLPPTFRAEKLVELCMRDSQLEYLWQGPQKLPNLKKMDLRRSFQLKELPDFSNATKLEELKLSHCKSLVEIPSSFAHLQNLKKLWMKDCINLQDTPPQLNLASLGLINMKGLRNLSFMSTNLRNVNLSYTEIQDVASLIRLWPRLRSLKVVKSGNLRGFTHLPTSLTHLDLSYTDIERIPDCIKALRQLGYLYLFGCRRLASLPELPGSLSTIKAEDCESLETIYCPLNTSKAELRFTNCLKLDQQAQREIIRQSLRYGWALLPGTEVPEKFDQRVQGSSLTICLAGNTPLSSLSRLKLAVVVSPNHQISENSGDLLCRRIGQCGLAPVEDVSYAGIIHNYRAKHLFIFDYDLPLIDPSEVNREILLEFSCTDEGCQVIECGAYIWTDETKEERHLTELDQQSEDNQLFADKGLIITMGRFITTYAR